MLRDNLWARRRTRKCPTSRGFWNAATRLATVQQPFIRSTITVGHRNSLDIDRYNNRVAIQCLGLQFNHKLMWTLHMHMLHVPHSSSWASQYHDFGQDLQQTWCEANLEELKRFLQDAVFRGEYVPAGILKIDVIPSEEAFNNFCDHYGLVRTGGKGKCQMLS